MHPLFLKQPHLAQGFETLSLQEQQAFLSQFPPDLLDAQRKGWGKKQRHLTPLWEEAHEVAPSQDLLPLGALILAGGQGSRLHASLPKALVPLNAKGTTLLEIFCQKAIKASSLAKAPLKLAIMTSPSNHQEIDSYLKQHHYFGLQSIDLFPQTLAPFLDDHGNWILEKPGHLAQGPDGNGGCLAEFVKAGLWNQWSQKGVRYLNVIPIDNPLADPFDSRLLQFHQDQSAEVTLKAIVRQPPNEAVGVIGIEDGKIAVHEYTELPENNVSFRLAHIGIYCFSFDFVGRSLTFDLPWHLVRKPYQGLFVWKAEKFIFDVLPYSHATAVMVCSRSENYSPLKNRSGEKSLETVRTALEKI